MSSAYLRVLIFLPAILLPACASSSPTFHMMYSAYKLNMQSDNIQPWHTPFPIWNQSIIPCLVLTVASWPGYRSLRKQVRCPSIPISWRIFHSLLWSTQSRALAQSLKLRQMFLWNLLAFSMIQWMIALISGSSAFSKCSLYIWNFLVDVLLKRILENFEHCLDENWRVSKFAVMLSATLTQHHLLGFEIAQLEFHPLH